jgi:hypothetical protein
MNGVLRSDSSLVMVSMSAVVFVAAAWLAPETADAQRRGGRQAAAATPAGPTAEQTAAARAAYGEGQRLFGTNDFAGALAQFEAAFASVPNPVVLLSIAESQERLGRVVDAVATLERYLTLRTDAPDRAGVQTRIDGLRARPGVIAVSSEPVGAAIALDGTDTGRVTPADVEAAPGEHTIAASLAGYEPASQTVTVAFGARQELAIPALTATPAPPPAEPVAAEPEPAPAPPVEEEPASEGPGTAVWIAAGVGAAGLVSGTVLGFLALSEQSDFDVAPTEAIADRGERLALFADVGFGVAVAGLVTALVLQLASGDDEEEAADPAAATTARLQVAPVVGANGGGVSAHLTF